MRSRQSSLLLLCSSYKKHTDAYAYNIDMFYRKLNLREMYIIKQSNLELRVNFMNRTTCDMDKVHLIHIKASGKPHKVHTSSEIQAICCDFAAKKTWQNKDTVISIP